MQCLPLFLHTRSWHLSSGSLQIRQRSKRARKRGHCCYWQRLNATFFQLGSSSAAGVWWRRPQESSLVWQCVTLLRTTRALNPPSLGHLSPPANTSTQSCPLAGSWVRPAAKASIGGTGSQHAGRPAPSFPPSIVFPGTSMSIWTHMQRGPFLPATRNAVRQPLSDMYF